MDREALRRQSAGRRTSAEVEQAPTRSLWTCEYCARGFVGEKSFMNHVCKDKLRIDALKSPLGQAAYSYYDLWMRSHGRSVPTIDKFGESRYFSTFLKFAEHVKKVHIPNVATFIKVMADNGKVGPELWCRDNVYAMYLKGYDKAVPPERQFMESLELLEKLAADYEVPVSAIFKEVPHSKLVELIERRKLSHWFLLASKVFRQHMVDVEEQRRDDLERAMNISSVITRVQQEPALFKELNEATRQVGL